MYSPLWVYCKTWLPNLVPPTYRCPLGEQGPIPFRRGRASSADRNADEIAEPRQVERVRAILLAADPPTGHQRAPGCELFHHSRPFSET